MTGVGAANLQNSLKVGGFSLPGTEFNTTSNILARDLNISSDKAADLVFHSDQHLVTEKVFFDEVDRVTRSLQQSKNITKVETVYTTGIPDFVSRDNHTTYALVTLTGSEEQLERATPDLRRLVQSKTLTVYLIGQASANYDIETASADDLVRVERFTFPVIFILLVLVFGSLVAAGIPLVLGAVGVFSSLGVLYIVAQLTDVSIFALNTASMIGLGLAIDFSLIMVSRFREELVHQSVQEALNRTLQTAGRSITFSGITLILTMAVLTLFPVMIIRSIAMAIMIVAAVAVLSGLLLLPALLAVLGNRVNSLNLRNRLPGLGGSREGMWYRWAHAVMRRPWASIAAALLVLGLLALPALKMQRTGVTVLVLPKSSESRQAYELLQRQFGQGEPAPLFVVIQADRPNGVWTPGILQGIYDLHTRLIADPRVAHVQSLASLIPNPTADWIKSLSPATIDSNVDRKRIAQRLVNIDGTNTTTTLIVYPRRSETDPETVSLMKDLRAQAKQWAPTLQNVRVLVGGSPAEHYDFDKVVYDQFPLLLVLSLVVTFAILMLFFHSLVLPLKAILMNLASIVASYGVLVLIFQYGVADWLLRFHHIGAVLSYTPVLLFSILFGLSTDYEVFLLTRVRESYNQGHTNEEAVAHGLERTAGVITAAGLIMIAVFGSFALTSVLVIKEIGLGLAVAVLIDTTLVRVVLVPATMKLMGAWNWWMPRGLGRLVPEIEEGEAPPASTPAGAPVSGS